MALTFSYTGVNSICKIVRAALACVQINPEGLFVGADFHLGVHTGTQDVSICRVLNLANAAATSKAFGIARVSKIADPRYKRTNSALVAGIHPRRLFGSAA